MSSTTTTMKTLQTIDRLLYENLLVVLKYFNRQIYCLHLFLY